MNSYDQSSSSFLSLPFWVIFTAPHVVSIVGVKTNTRKVQSLPSLFWILRKSVKLAQGEGDIK